MTNTKQLLYSIPSVVLLTLVLVFDQNWALYLMATITWLIGLLFLGLVLLHTLAGKIHNELATEAKKAGSILTVSQLMIGGLIALAVFGTYFTHGLFITSIVSLLTFGYSLHMQKLARSA